MLQRFLALVVLLFATTSTRYAICEETSASLTPTGQQCSSSLSWDCYGTFEVSINMIGGDDSAVPFLLLKIIHFSNHEVQVESDSFIEKSKKIYLVSRPSGIELFQGWAPNERPLNFVLAEQASVMEILKAAFPNGPKSVEKADTRVIAQVKKYVYPIGDKIEKIPVVARKIEGAKIQIQFNDIGEPIGPYQVLATWSPSAFAPLQNDYPVNQMKTKLGKPFETLGEARLYLKDAQ